MIQNPQNPGENEKSGEMSSQEVNELAEARRREALDEETHDLKYGDKIPQHETHFRSCPACRGSGKLDLRCSVCAGRGSVTTDPEGNPAPSVTDNARRLLEAARVAIMPTTEFEAMKKHNQDEAIEWALRWLTTRAKNLAATQDYLGEHRLNAAVVLMRNDWNEEHGSDG